MQKGEPLFCPLYERNISTGKCLDINYERLNYVQYDYFKDLVKIRKLTLQELEKICYDCPNQPFPDNEIGEIEVNK